MSSNNAERTSDGLRDLLIRHGVKPTMNRCDDIKLAKKFMPASYLEYQLVGYVKPN